MDKYQITIKGKIGNAEELASKYGMGRIKSGKYFIYLAEVDETTADEFIAESEPEGCWTNAQPVATEDEIEDDEDSAPPYSGKALWVFTY